MGARTIHRSADEAEDQTLQSCRSNRFSRGPVQILRIGRFLVDGLIRCQTSVKTFPASRPPATLTPICMGMYRALDTALITAKFPTRRTLNL